MRRQLLCSLGFLALSGMAQACTYFYVPHAPGQAFVSRPAAVFEARVVEVRDENEMVGFIATPVQTGVIEVTRWVDGAHGVGERLPTRTVMNGSCSTRFRVGQAVIMWLRGEQPPYAPRNLSGPGEYEMEGMFREIAEMTAE